MLTCKDKNASSLHLICLIMDGMGNKWDGMEDRMGWNGIGWNRIEWNGEQDGMEWRMEWNGE